MLGDSDSEPIIKAHKGWTEYGCEYGSWCRCCICGLVARSTFTFDFYVKDDGDLLTCESCYLGSKMAPEVSNKIAEKILLDEKQRREQN